MKSDFFLGLEIHDVSIWDVKRTLHACDVMEERGYNALILHENDLLDATTQVGDNANFGVADLRWKKVSNRLAWLNKLTKRLDQFGAKLYLEIKEPSFHDYLIESYPEILDDTGKVNALSHVWAQICREKTEQIIKNVPLLGGLIVTLSSPEARVSLQDYIADTNKEVDFKAWLSALIDAFHVPLSKVGKDLFVRDFAYTKHWQKETLDVIDCYDGAVGASIKITAHDYFPRFPNNDVAFDVKKAPKIFEFEAFGEHVGWGVVPNCRVAEFIDRMNFVNECGGSGAFIRVSWEAMSGPSALDCLSDVNVYALSQIVNGNKDSLSIVKQWCVTRYGLQDVDLIEEISQCLLESWTVIANAYMDDKVFPRHSRLPSSWQEGWHSMLTSGMGNRHLEEGYYHLDEIGFSKKDISRVFKEKEEASNLAKSLWQRVLLVLSKCPENLQQDLSLPFELLPFYAQKFEYGIKGTLICAENTSHDKGFKLDELKACAENLEMIANQVEIIINGRGVDAPHTVSVLFDPEHIRKFSQSLRNSFDFFYKNNEQEKVA